MSAMDRRMLSRTAMRLTSFAGFTCVALLAVSTTACGGIWIDRPPAPPAPRRVEPTSPSLPADPPPAGQARVVFDAEGEQAKVSRVVASMNFEGQRKARLDTKTSLAPMRAEEPLCITPCAVDLRHGMHTFVFTSTNDSLRSSTTEVVLPSNASTTFVRHAIGNEGHVSPGYVGGAVLLLLGSGLTAMGGLTTAVGAFAEPEMQKDGTMSDPQVLLVPGLVMLGVGLATGTIGVVMMNRNRPVQQSGSTTTWTKE